MGNSTESSDVDRRQFLKTVGVAGAGAAVLSGCSTDKVERLVPYLVQSEQQIPGEATWYASTCTECSVGCGIHVKTREGRPIKLEGNPDSPINAGSLCSRGQAGLQGLYNPDRMGKPRARNAAGGFDEIEWDDAIARLAAKVGGAGSRIAALNGYGPSTFSTLLENWVGALGGKTVNWSGFAREAERQANQRTFGRNDLPLYHFEKAEYILSFGADFLESWGPTATNERGFAASHGFHDGRMARHVFVGPRLSLTAGTADQWLDVAPGKEALVALAVASVVATRKGHAMASQLSRYAPDQVAGKVGLDASELTAIADAFAAASPSLAVAGGVPAQHRGAILLCDAVNLLNEVAGNVGKTVVFGGSPALADGYDALLDLFDSIDKGEVAVLLVHESNPLYVLPKSGNFTERFSKAGFKVSTAQVFDETAAACDLILPNLHSLERWDDLLPQSGVRGTLQPTISPVFDARHTGDVLLAVSKQVGGSLAQFDAPTFEDHLKAEWARVIPGGADGTRQALGKGGVFAEVSAVQTSLVPSAVAPDYVEPEFDGEGEFVFLPYPSMQYYDGRGANKPWLLEVPDPISKITWQSWVEIHPETAKRLDIRDGERVFVTSPHGEVEVQAWVFAGVRPDVVAMPMGLGHTEYGRYAKGRGANAMDLIGAQDGQGFLPFASTRVSIRRSGSYRQLARTDGTPRQLGRHIIETMPVALAARGMTPEEAYKAIGGEIHEINTPLEQEALEGWSERQIERQKYGDYARVTPKWGMAVDLSRCTGCSACITACYAENNIPTVGEEEIFRGREMSWMRVDRYWEGGEGNDLLQVRYAPVMCQHCDNAPCEPVCPVYAAYHTPDGLNGQVYNRCVGTRYCSNNCPFKVRYFNWSKYNEKAWPEPLNLQLNPEVTVRARGVMEKCTFCVQRIRHAQHVARLEDREVRDGEITPACVQACGSGAMTFGNVNDPDARVVQMKRDARGYHMLEDLNIRPAVTYLARVLHQEPVQIAGHGPASEESGGA